MIYDVFVAGLGVMGSALARAAAQAGLQVIACDKLTPPHERGSSHGESRIIRSAYFEDPIYAPLARRALTLWRELETESERRLLHPTGGLNVGPSDGLLVTGALASARAHGIDYELLDARTIRQRFPALSPRDTDVALYEPDAGVLLPEACVSALLGSARTAGARIQLDEPLLRWQSEGTELRLTTTRDEYRARHLILSVGAWLKEFRSELPLVVTRQPVFWFAPTEPDLHQPHVLPNYLIEFEPNRIFYGFPDLGRGVKCAIHHEGRPTDPDQVDRHPNTAEVAAVAAQLHRFLPGAAGPLVRTSVCLYTNTPNQHFLIDRAPGHERPWLVSACSGHGFKFAPAIAELTLGALAGQSPLPAVFRYPKG